MSQMTKVFHPPVTFADAIDGLASFAREHGLALGALEPDELTRLRDAQRDERTELKALERKTLETARDFAKAQALRFKRFMKALEIARAEFREDSAMLKLLEAFSVAAYRHVHQNSANGAATPSTPTTENAPMTEPNHP